MGKITKDLDKLTDKEIADMVAQDLYDAERTVEIKIAEEKRKQFAKEEEARAKEFEKLPKEEQEKIKNRQWKSYNETRFNVIAGIIIFILILMANM